MSKKKKKTESVRVLCPECCHVTNVKYNPWTIRAKCSNSQCGAWIDVKAILSIYYNSESDRKG